MATSILRKISAFRAEVAVGEITAIFVTDKPIGEKLVWKDVTLLSKSSNNPDDAVDGEVNLSGRTYTQLKSRALYAMRRERDVLVIAAQRIIITEKMREEAAELAEQDNIPDSDR